MTRVFSCFLLLCAVARCDCEWTVLPAADEPLTFSDGLWVHLAPETSADEVMLDNSGGEESILTDPDGNDWLLTTTSGFTAIDFLQANYEDGWFTTPTGDGQRFFCRFILGKEDAGDLMLDEPSRCSVYLDGGYNHYARLDRTADTVPCPTVAQYATWLPAVVSHAVPFSLP